MESHNFQPKHGSITPQRSNRLVDVETLEPVITFRARNVRGEEFEFWAQKSAEWWLTASYLTHKEPVVVHREPVVEPPSPWVQITVKPKRRKR